FLQLAGPLLVPGARAARAGEPVPDDHGRVDPPRPVPDLEILRHDGGRGPLPDLVNHRATAVQLMFTSCTSTCPIQGAIFARVQRLLPDHVGRGIQLLSLSVDPDHDTPPVLRSWLDRFQARAGWIAAAPQPADVERLRDFSGRA